MSDPCAICKEDIDINKRVITSCNHAFHSECFFKWLKKKANCPVCRTVFKEPNSYEIDQEREELNNLRLTIDDQIDLFEEIKDNCFDASLEHTLLINGCQALKAEQELKRVDILNMQNNLNQLTANYNSIRERRRIELYNLEKIIIQQGNIINRRRQRSRIGRMNF